MIYRMIEDAMKYFYQKIFVIILLKIIFAAYLFSTCGRALYHILGNAKYIEKWPKIENAVIKTSKELSDYNSLVLEISTIYWRNA